MLSGADRLCPCRICRDLDQLFPGDGQQLALIDQSPARVASDDSHAGGRNRRRRTETRGSFAPPATGERP